MLGTARRERKAWVVWEEDGLTPNVVVELLSESTEAVDRGAKMRIYARSLRVAEYFLFDPDSGELLGYRLTDAGGKLAYAPLAPDANGRLLSRHLGLQLGRWEGEYRVEIEGKNAGKVE